MIERIIDRPPFGIGGSQQCAIPTHKSQHLTDAGV